MLIPVLVEQWVEGSEESLRIMTLLYKNNEYTNALFYGQLTLEKLLKALYAKTNKENPHAPKTHNLVLLADKCNLNVDDEMKKELATISRFNLEARYDDEKKDFFKTCTKEFTQKQIVNIKEIREWLKEKLIQK